MCGPPSTGIIMNKLIITGIKQNARVGCSAEERGWPQFLMIDLVLELNMEKCIASDDLHDTVDYVMILNKVRGLCDEREWILLEKMCADISSELLKESLLLSSVTTRVGKNISAIAEGVQCEVTIKR